MKKSHILAAFLLVSIAFSPASFAGQLQRFATVPIKAEVTGLYITEQGDLFFNVQHPSGSIDPPFNRAMIGYVKDVDFRNLPVAFSNLPVAKSRREKSIVRVAIGAYGIIARKGDFASQMKGGLGAIVATNGDVILKSNKPDFNAFIPASDDGRRGYIFTNWENKPGGMSRIRIVKDNDGRWTASDPTHVDFSSVRGTWHNCFGSVSPWGTPLTSEELYFDNTASWNNVSSWRPDGRLRLARYLGKFPNPYDYGYIVEITDPAGAAKPVKHFAMGRFSHENAVAMPDQKTVYLSDDGSNTVFFKFVADQAGDLSAGTLYAAKFKQRDESNAADPATTSFDISWIALASGSNSVVERWKQDYDGLTPDDHKSGTTSYISDQEISSWARGKAKDDRVAFLESRKAARAKGATAEFNKMEGVMINYAGAKTGRAPFMYIAMSDISGGMADGKGSIRLKANKCGVVYRMKLQPDYDVNSMKPAVAGGPYKRFDWSNQCATDGIANPDNLLVLNDGRVLIGEDTRRHENNVLWIWSPADHR